MEGPDAEFLRVSEMLLKKGLKPRDVYPGKLTAILGGTGTSAMVFFLGEDAFADPKILLGRIKIIFGDGADVLIQGLVDRAEEVLRSGSGP